MDSAEKTVPLYIECLLHASFKRHDYVRCSLGPCQRSTSNQDEARWALLLLAHDETDDGQRKSEACLLVGDQRLIPLVRLVAISWAKSTMTPMRPALVMS
jgi:hypothetical protein